MYDGLTIYARAEKCIDFSPSILSEPVLSVTEVVEVLRVIISRRTSLNEKTLVQKIQQEIYSKE